MAGGTRGRSRAVERVTQADLRRRVAGRREAERMVALAEHLDPADRALVLAVFQRGMTLSELARVGRCQPYRLARRLRRIVRHVESRRFRVAVARLDALGPEVRTVARLAILQGRPLRDVARTTGLSLHRVRTCCLTIDALAELYK